MIGALSQRGQRIAMIGAAIEDGAGRPGTALGPAALRGGGLGSLASRTGRAVVDLGDYRPPPCAAPAAIDLGANVRHAGSVARSATALSAAAYEISQRGDTPVFLGGDHSLSIGSVNGVSRFWAERQRPLFVLWLDAHADINTPATTPSGNLHGMALAALCGEPALAPLLAAAGPAPVEPHRVMLFGTRSLDRGEEAALMRCEFMVAGMSTIRAHGVIPPLRALLDQVAACDGALHVSVDVDVLDPSLAPGVGTPVPDGLGYGDAQVIANMLACSGLVTSLDVVEVNPLRDATGGTAAIAACLAATMLDASSLTMRTVLEATEREEPHHEQLSY